MLGRRVAGRGGWVAGTRHVPASHDPRPWGPTAAFRSYFEILNGHGEVNAQSLGNILLLVGISITPAQVEDALMSADVDGERGRRHSECQAGPAIEGDLSSPTGLHASRGLRAV